MIVLSGPPRVGKTTVARHLARERQVVNVDTDVRFCDNEELRCQMRMLPTAEEVRHLVWRTSGAEVRELVMGITDIFGWGVWAPRRGMLPLEETRRVLFDKHPRVITIGRVPDCMVSPTSSGSTAPSGTALGRWGTRSPLPWPGRWQRE